MTVTVGTDSYVDESTLTAYATARGLTLTEDTTELLIKAMDWLEIQPFTGTRYEYDQALQFPRSNYNIYEGDTAGEVPQEIKNAQMVAAILVDNGYDLTPVVGRAIKREKIDVIEVEYQDQANDTNLYPQLTFLLKRFLSNTGGSFEVMRG